MADADLDRAVAGHHRRHLPQPGRGLPGRLPAVRAAADLRRVLRPVRGRRRGSWWSATRGTRRPQIGPLVSAEHLDKVLVYIELGHAEGAKLLTGGQPGDRRRRWRTATTWRRRCSPTWTTAGGSPARRSSARSRSSRRSTPWTRRSRWPTTTATAWPGMIWTTNLDTAHRVAREVRTGTMWVNCFFVRDLRAPFGGMKDSGVGPGGRPALGGVLHRGQGRRHPVPVLGSGWCPRGNGPSRWPTCPPGLAAGRCAAASPCAWHWPTGQPGRGRGRLRAPRDGAVRRPRPRRHPHLPGPLLAVRPAHRPVHRAPGPGGQLPVPGHRRLGRGQSRPTAPPPARARSCSPTPPTPAPRPASSARRRRAAAPLATRAGRRRCGCRRGRRRRSRAARSRRRGALSRCAFRGRPGDRAGRWRRTP